MALKNLIEKDCGGNNPLINFAQQFRPEKVSNCI